MRSNFRRISRFRPKYGERSFCLNIAEMLENMKALWYTFICYCNLLIYGGVMDATNNASAASVADAGFDEKAFYRRFKKEGRRVKGISPMSGVAPYIMVNRNDASNMIIDHIRMEKIDEYIRDKRAQGLTDFSLMHVFVAAYVRTVSQKPQINRFIRGQKIYTRDHIEVNLTIKKEMTLESPDTVVKAFLMPDATADDVYYEFKRIIDGYRNAPGGDFDDTAKFINYIPGLVKKWVCWNLKLLDYFGWLPRGMTRVSPFHGSMFITSMGSLGIPTIYHHLYNFGNVPIFISFGAKYRRNELNDDGTVDRRQYVDFSVVMDERICDGYYYASALKTLKNIVRNPWCLDAPPETVVKDIR